MPDGGRLCHGDFHPNNIMGPPGHEVLIGWLDASPCEPAADICRSYVLLRSGAPDIASPDVDAWSRVSGTSHSAIPNLLPSVAAARLAEGVPDIGDLMRMVDG